MACARVALSPSGGRTGVSSGYVSPTFRLTVSAGDLLPQVQETLAELAAVEGMHGSQDLFRARVSPLLEWLAASHRDWTGHSVELLQLDVVLTHSGEPWTGAPSWVQSIAAVAALAAPAQTGGAALTTQPATHRGPLLHSLMIMSPVGTGHFKPLFQKVLRMLQ